MSNISAGLEEYLAKEIIKIVTSHKNVDKIILYGSRATDTFRRTSDIDLAILDKNWTSRDINLVKFNLNEYVKTPLKFDVVSFYDLTKESLKENILRDGRIIYESKKKKHKR